MAELKTEKMKVGNGDTIFFPKDVDQLEAKKFLELVELMKGMKISDEGDAMSILIMIPDAFVLFAARIEDKEGKEKEVTAEYLKELSIKNYRPIQAKVLSLVTEMFQTEEE